MGNGVLTAGRKQPIDKTRARGKKTPAQRESLKTLKTHINQIEERLSQAQNLTQVSVKALQASFEKLSQANKRGVNDTTTRLAEHIDKLTAHLTELIEQTRIDVAHDLQIVMSDPRVETLTAALTKANQRLSRAEVQQAKTINEINDQIAHLASGLEQEIQARQQADEDLGQRLSEIETQSTQAIKSIGDKVVEATESLQKKADEARREIGEKGLSLQHDFEEHKADMAMRIEAMEDDQRNTIPSIERRLVTLTTRLEVLEATKPLQAAEQNVAATRSEEVAPPYALPPHINETVAPVAAQEEPHFVMPTLVHTDAFSPSEAIISQSVTPPENPYALKETQTVQTGYQATSPLAVANAQSDPFTPQEYQPQEFQPQEYQAQEFSAQDYQQPEYLSTAPTLPNDLQTLANVAGNIAPVEPPVAGYPYAQGEPDPYGQYASPYTQPATTEMAPPPFAADLDMESMQSMVEARPAADTPPAKTSLFAKIASIKGGNQRAKTGVSMPVKTTAMMVGVAVIGLFAAKTIMPKFMGGDDPSPLNADVSQSQMEARPVREDQRPSQIGNAETPIIQTVDAVGDYAKTMKAPELGEAPGGGASQQRLTLEAAAAKGEAIAQFQLGLSHLEAGRNGQAVRLIRLAANQNQAAAQYRLGKLYEAGVGVPANPRMAVEYLEQAAFGGNRIAMHDLGHYYATGVVGPADIDLAVDWFKKAALRGVLDSQFNLGVLYQGGSGVPKDIVESYVWYAVAGAQGDKVAAQRAQLVANDLSQEQLAQAQERIKSFTPTPINDAANGVFRDLPWVMSVKTEAPSAGPDNNSVKQAQSLLLSLGYDVGAPDGAMGPRTRNAVISFERANSLPETGRVNAALLDRLSLAAGV